MKLLLLGGTSFLGRALVTLALQKGHEVSLFHRGRTNPGLFPEAETILGDRSTDLDRLAGRSWDVVIDTSGYFPHHVAASAKELSERAGRYIFVSTMLVYRDMERLGLKETDPLADLPDQLPTQITNETIGPLKAACERAAEAAFPGRLLVARPGAIVGPHGPGHFGMYWPARIARGGEILAPGRPDYPVQWIDARDLAAWLLSMAEAGETGTYNTMSPRGWLTLGQVIDSAQEAAGTDHTVTWVPEEFLREQGVVPSRDLPLWNGERLVSWMSLDTTLAAARGLTCRSPVETSRDTQLWLQGPDKPVFGWTGLSAEKERAILQAWYERKRG